MLGGKHHCHVWAAFVCTNRKCGSSWNSKQGKYDPRTEYLLGQNCKTCGTLGNGRVTNYSPEPVEPDPYKEKAPHRSDLCEACTWYGNCMGLFSEPFGVHAGLVMQGYKTIQWKMVNGQLEARCGNNRCIVILPHVFEERSNGKGATSGKTGKSKGEDKGKSKGEGKAKGKGKGKGKGKPAGTGAGKGAGKGKGNRGGKGK